ncbi:uncharacterized protein [Palaemon carinicauda]|uniref:uncharacterized protein n=1 Tax=Palaemon carinicauda TaxID=392227 RepID=UPI0035B5EC9A
MRIRSGLVLLGCLGGALAVNPASGPGAEDPSKVLMKRDDQHHAHPPTAHAPVLDSYATTGTGGGQYYYYHPVEEAPPPEPAEPADSNKKDYCPIDTVLAPVIVITVFAGVLAANALGMVPRVAFGLPGDTINAINALKPDPLGVKPNIIGDNAWIPAVATGRRARSEDGEGEGFMGNLTQVAFDQVTSFVMDAIETDDCSSRLICESGRYADGRKGFLSILHFLTPAIYRNKLKIFKDSALKKSDCKEFQCGYADYNTI